MLSPGLTSEGGRGLGTRLTVLDSKLKDGRLPHPLLVFHLVARLGSGDDVTEFHAVRLY